MSETKKSKCCSCGYEWITGQDGTHSCILSLQRQLAVIGWISVDDRLPEDGDAIICVLNIDEPFRYEIYNGYNPMDFSNYYKDVTHWRKLEPPK